MGYDDAMTRFFRRHWRFLAATTAVLFLAFTIDLFGAQPPAAFISNFQDSEALVTNQLICRGQPYGNQLLEIKTPEPGQNTFHECRPDVLKPYSSQFGLQGKIYTLAYQATTKVVPIGPLTFVALARIGTALLSAFVLALFVLWVRLRFGLIPAITTTALIGLSPMLVGFARNLFWALPLFVTPLVYALYRYNPLARIKQQIPFWAIVGLLLYLRYLCGYEYLTTLTIMVAAAVAYHLYRHRSPFTQYLRQFGLVLGVSVLAFALALATHMATLSQTAGSTANAITVVKSRALERTANADHYLAYPAMGLQANLSDAYRISNNYLNLDDHAQKSRIWAAVAATINYALMPVAVSPVALVQPFATYMQSLLAFVLLLVVLYRTRHRWAARVESRELRALFLAAALGLVGLLSWLVMAPSHSLVHAHINGILLYLPFALFGYVILGIGAQTLVSCLRRHLK